MNCVDIINSCILCFFFFLFTHWSIVKYFLFVTDLFFVQVIVSQVDFSTAAHIADLGNNNKFDKPKVSDYYCKPLSSKFYGF